MSWKKVTVGNHILLTSLERIEIKMAYFVDYK